MGAKASTANSNDSSGRERTFSTSSGSEVAGSVTTTSGFSLLRSIPSVSSNDRQRARSLSCVPDAHESLGIQNSRPSDGAFDISESQETDSSIEDHTLDSPNIGPANIGRVYAAHSLPSHIWSWNGIKCPVCSKFVLPDDIEIHLVMCLTKPRLIYNEDVLTDDKGECAICLDELTQGDTIARLPCLCIYHKSCIDRWFEVNRSCPEHPGE